MFAFQTILRRIRGIAALLLVVIWMAPATVRAEDAYILDVLRSPDKEGQVTVSARLYGAFTEDIRETIASGAPVTFAFTLRLKRERTLLGDKTTAELIIKRMVKFDTLTKEYWCWEKRGGEGDELDFEAELASLTGGAKPSPPVSPPLTLRDQASLRRWMTSLSAVPVAPIATLEPGEVYYFAVRAEMDATELITPFNYILFFITLLDFDTDWGLSAPFMPAPLEERP